MESDAIPVPEASAEASVLQLGESAPPSTLLQTSLPLAAIYVARFTYSTKSVPHLFQ